MIITYNLLPCFSSKEGQEAFKAHFGEEFKLPSEPENQLELALKLVEQEFDYEPWLELLSVEERAEFEIRVKPNSKVFLAADEEAQKAWFETIDSAYAVYLASPGQPEHGLEEEVAWKAYELVKDAAHKERARLSQAIVKAYYVSCWTTLLGLLNGNHS
jgi:hypothetical protein